MPFYEAERRRRHERDTRRRQAWVQTQLVRALLHAYNRSQGSQRGVNERGREKRRPLTVDAAFEPICGVDEEVGGSNADERHHHQSGVLEQQPRY